MANGAAHIERSKTKKPRRFDWVFWTVAAWFVFLIFNPRLNPANWFLEATSSGYQQAYQVLVEGKPSDAALVRDLMSDGKLSMHDIDLIWKPYLTLPNISAPIDKDMTVEQGRERLASAIRSN